MISTLKQFRVISQSLHNILWKAAIKCPPLKIILSTRVNRINNEHSCKCLWYRIKTGKRRKYTRKTERIKKKKGYLRASIRKGEREASHLVDGRELRSWHLTFKPGKRISLLPTSKCLSRASLACLSLGIFILTPPEKDVFIHINTYTNFFFFAKNIIC